ncbi:MAG: hypothetical protein QM739_15175 [Propionivibrio sp.]
MRDLSDAVMFVLPSAAGFVVAQPARNNPLPRIAAAMERMDSLH